MIHYNWEKHISNSFFVIFGFVEFLLLELIIFHFLFRLFDFDFAFIENSLKPIPENIPLDIIWEDENMAVINKPSNMLTHPTLQEMNGTLVNALLYHYGENLLKDSEQVFFVINTDIDEKFYEKVYRYS